MGQGYVGSLGGLAGGDEARGTLAGRLNWEEHSGCVGLIGRWRGGEVRSAGQDGVESATSCGPGAAQVRAAWRTYWCCHEDAPQWAGLDGSMHADFIWTWQN